MGIRVKCKCGKRIRAKIKYSGRTITCPSCKSPILIPAADSVSEKSSGSYGLDGSALSNNDADLPPKSNKSIRGKNRTSENLKSKPKLLPPYVPREWGEIVSDPEKRLKIPWPEFRVIVIVSAVAAAIAAGLIVTGAIAGSIAFTIAFRVAIWGLYSAASCWVVQIFLSVRERHMTIVKGRKTRIDRLVDRKRVKVKGRIVASTQLLTSPLWHEPCVYYEVHVTDRFPGRGQDGGDSLATAFAACEGVKCLVDDGSGQAIVDCQVSNVLLYRFNRSRPKYDDPVPFHEDSIEREYREGMLKEGDSVVVIGTVLSGDQLPRIVPGGRYLTVSQTGKLGSQKVYDMATVAVWLWGVAGALMVMYLLWKM